MNRLRLLLTNNPGLKALSLLLALLLWHQVASQQVVQWSLTIPVAFTNIPLDLEVVNDPIREVRVDVRSDRGSLAIEQRRLTAVVDLQNAKAGTELIQLSEQNINRTPGLEIRTIDPPRIRVDLEHTRTRNVPVEPVLEGRPAEGYRLVEVRTVPAEIVVSGPESLVEEVKQVQTAPVNIADARQTLTQSTFVDLDAPKLRINDVNVTVVVNIEEERKPARVNNVPVQIRPIGSAWQLQETSVNLRGTIPLSFDETLDRNLFEVVVDVSNLETEQTTLELAPQVSIPEDYIDIFRLESIQPEKLRIRKVRQE